MSAAVGLGRVLVADVARSNGKDGRDLGAGDVVKSAGGPRRCRSRQ